MPVAIELRKDDEWDERRCTRQAFLKLLAISRKMMHAVLVVLTDLRARWHFFYFDTDGKTMRHESWRSGGMQQLQAIVRDVRDALGSGTSGDTVQSSAPRPAAMGCFRTPLGVGSGGGAHEPLHLPSTWRRRTARAPLRWLDA